MRNYIYILFFMIGAVYASAQNPPKITTTQIQNLIVDSTRINATGDTAYYYQNGVLIGTGPIAGGGGGTTYNNISETVDTVFIDKFFEVDTNFLIVNANLNRLEIFKDNINSSTTGGPKPKTLDYDSYKNIAFLLGSTVSMADPRGFGFFSAPNNLNFTRNGYYDGSSWRSLTDSINSNAGAVNNYSVSFGIGEYGIIGFKDKTITNNNEVLGFSQFFNITVDGDTYFNTLNGATSLSGLKALYYNTSTGQLSYDNTSSLKMKNNIMPYKRGINDLIKVDVVEFTYKSDGNKDYGVIAEQLLEIGLDEFVFYNENGIIQGVEKRHFIPLMLKAIQEQQAIIESQATEIEQLKTLITELSNRLTILENN